MASSNPTIALVLPGVALAAVVGVAVVSASAEDAGVHAFFQTEARLRAPAVDPVRLAPPPEPMRVAPRSPRTTRVSHLAVSERPPPPPRRRPRPPPRPTSAPPPPAAT